MWQEDLLCQLAIASVGVFGQVGIIDKFPAFSHTECTRR
ncbi:MAG: hypothetical protein QOJ99_3379 [Bryobacterales bacterium]|jgi:hypothetical protein|nr:hypothetical protein [Bryobacterales bacterium]